jgi:hypothetical protein
MKIKYFLLIKSVKFFFKLYMKYFIVILLFIFSLNLFSQKKVKIEFKYPLSDNVSFDVGKEIAIQKAKEEALRKGGIGENIKSFSTLSKTQNNKDFKSIFSSDIFAEITGFCEITEWIKYPEKFFNEEENAYYINLSFMAKISKYDSKPDPQFVMQVEGLKVGYKSNNDNNQENNLNLRIIPSMDCYLKIFYLTDDKTSIVYPIETTERVSQNPEFKDEILIANKEKLVNYIEPVTDKKIEL